VSSRVAIVASTSDNRSTAAAYLKSAGFDVHVYVELAVPSSFDGLVLLDDDDRVVAQVRSWIKASRSLRVIVVTAKPAALRELAATHPARLAVLAAPVFGWQLVDALRAKPESGPRGA
jgi:glycerophosphoryl diester phosphodiesterase